MLYLIIALSVFEILQLSVFVLRACALKDEKGAVVCLPRFSATAGTIISVFFLSIACVAFIYDRHDLTLFFLACAYIGIVLIIAFCNDRIYYDPTDSFTVKSFWGFSRVYRYADVTAIRGRNGAVRVYVGSRGFPIGGIAQGRQEFIRRLKYEYRRSHDGEAVPTLPGKCRKLDIFNGHVDHAAGHLVSYALVFVVIITMLVFSVIETAAAPKSEDDLIYIQTSFDRYEISKKDVLTLYHGEDAYSAGEINDTPQLRQKLSEICAEERMLSVGYAKGIWMKRIYRLSDDSGTLIPERSFEGRWEGLKAMLLFIVLLTAWTWFVVRSVQVGRHPERYRRKTICRYFKERFVHK